MSFEQLTVIVTGAGQGIGRGVAEAYAKAGASVVLAELDLETGVKAEEESRQIGGKALFVPCDVRKEDDIIRLMETTEREFGSIDILINNAGVSRFKPLFSTTVEEWDDVLNTNVRAASSLPAKRNGCGGAAAAGRSSTSPRPGRSCPSRVPRRMRPPKARSCRSPMRLPYRWDRMESASTA